MRILASFIVVLLLFGCASRPAAHLTKRQVTDTAVALAQGAGHDLGNYEAPKVHFNPGSQSWTVFFDFKPPVGSWICVYIDDKTGVGKIVPDKR